MRPRSPGAAVFVLATVFAACLLSAALASAGDEAGCRPPAYVVHALRGAGRVDLVRLGPVGDCAHDPLARDRDPACFAGYVRRASFPLEPRAAAAVCRLLSPGNLGCASGGSRSRPAFVLGFDIAGRSGGMRVTLQLPSGAVNFEIPNGLCFGAALSPAGLREWGRAEAAIGRATGRSPVEFERDLARDAEPPPAPEPPAPSATSPLLKPVVPDNEAEPVTKVAPAYPDIAREAGVEGTVRVSVLVGTDGRPHETRVVKSIPMLDRAAVDAVMQWAFRPGTRGGKPVDSWLEVPVKFTLH